LKRTYYPVVALLMMHVGWGCVADESLRKLTDIGGSPLLREVSPAESTRVVGDVLPADSEVFDMGSEWEGSYCGDGYCQGDEDCATCGKDCGVCPFCADGECNGEENCGTCVQDCACGDLSVCVDDGCVTCSAWCAHEGFECGPQGACDCGTCDCGEECEVGTCVFGGCDGKSCGDDGCGGSCGECAAPNSCVSGQCSCIPDCTGKNCGEDGCQGVCGVCSEGWGCVGGVCECFPQCAGKECGDDGCGGSCGSCSGGGVWLCTNGQCECLPQCANKVCGDDLCGGNCGWCGPGFMCSSGHCECAPDCSGKECGSDGCGGSCGWCGPGFTCNSGHCECAPDCSGKECGSDGCGGGCGSCPDGSGCSGGTCVGSSSESCANDFDCLSQDCIGGKCAERLYCLSLSFQISHVDCESDSDCVVGGDIPEQPMSCETVEVDFWGLYVEHEVCLETSSCLESGGYLPCCTQGEFCGKLADSSETFGYACCEPGEILDTQGSDTICSLSTSKLYLCRKNSDCPTGWGLKKCYGESSSSYGECVECQSGTDCSGDTPYCYNKQCVECTSSLHCDGSTPYCKDHGCVECLTFRGYPPRSAMRSSHGRETEGAFVVEGAVAFSGGGA